MSGVTTICGPKGKQCYSKADALRVAREMRALEPVEGDTALLNAYSCRLCKRWHIGHNNRLKRSES